MTRGIYAKYHIEHYAITFTNNNFNNLERRVSVFLLDGDSCSQGSEY